MNQQNITGQTCRGGDLLLEQQDAVVELFLRNAFLRVDQVELVLELDQGVVAAAGHRRLGDFA